MNGAVQEGWVRHPLRQQLERLSAERDGRGEPTWHVVVEDDPDGRPLVWVWLRPCRQSDRRRPICIAAVRTAAVYGGNTRPVIDARALGAWPGTG